MKHEWKKHERDLYGAKKVPHLVTVPMQSYIMIRGKGNPKDTDFSERIAALYSLTYTIKMGYKVVRIKKMSLPVSMIILSILWRECGS